MTPRVLIAIICSTLVLLTPPAIAQDQSPNDILDASRDAIQELSGLSAQFRMKGEGGSMFADTLPSMNGQLFFGVHEELGRVIHCIGEIREQQSSPSQPIDLLIASDRHLWTDTQSRTINERPISSNTRGLPTAFSLVLLKSFVNDDPYANDANDAKSIDLLTQETVSGTLCDVIHIKRPKIDSRTSRAGKDAYTDARWYIGVEDKLPRKVEHITDAGLVKITLSFELTSTKVIQPTQVQLDVTRPDGFTFKSSMPKDQPSEPSDDEPADFIDAPVTPRTTKTTGLKPEPAAPRVKAAPSYSFSIQSGSDVNNASQEGKVTVLYFWGSWCVPCKATSPLISQLAQELDSEMVDVFGLAIREADPDQTSTNFTQSAYQHTLVLDADSLVSSFKIRVFPTIVVVNRVGEIAFQQSINKETSSQELVDSAKEAILFALEDE